MKFSFKEVINVGLLVILSDFCALYVM